MDSKEVRTSDGFVDSLNLVAQVVETGYPSRCGKVKRAPTLDEYDRTEPYNQSDESFFEERR